MTAAAAPPPGKAFRTRPERGQDAVEVAAVRAVQVAAFAGRPEAAGAEPAEARLLDALRADPAWLPHLSRVAEVEGAVVGHAVCTRAQVAGSAALGLGPVGVLPGFQGRGIGSALVTTLCAAADRRGEALVVLLGDPGFYGRLGFEPAAALGVVPPVAAWEPYFQARRLTAYDPARDRGAFTYAAPFAAL